MDSHSVEHIVAQDSEFPKFFFGKRIRQLQVDIALFSKNNIYSTDLIDLLIRPCRSFVSVSLRTLI